jgi:serine/threonine protein kinase
MTKEEVAIKFLKMRELKADSIHKVYQEVDALRKLDHRNIVKLKLAFPLQSSNSIVIVMKYASGGELKGYLKKRGRLDEEEAREIFYQLVDAVHYCHLNRIIHRDLKPNNIVFAKPNSRDIRVVDFGISGIYAINNHDTSLAGSLKYMAPEVLSGK